MDGFVTLEEARSRIRFDDVDSDGGIDDLDLQIMINSASRSVLNYIRSGFADFLDSNGDPAALDTDGMPIVPDDVKDAVLLWVAIKYRSRDEDGPVEQEYGYPPKQVLSILYHYRLPTLA